MDRIPPPLARVEMNERVLKQEREFKDMRGKLADQLGHGKISADEFVEQQRVARVKSWLGV